MNNEQAEQAARRLVAELINNSIENGFPFCSSDSSISGLVDDDGIITCKGVKVEHYIKKIAAELAAKAG